MAERNTQIDSLKFFLIFLVLVGHCLDINLGLHSNNALFRFIYSFHMPVFVILSGIMFKEKGVKKLIVGCITLAITYLVFQLLYGGKTLEYKGGSILGFWYQGFLYNVTHLYDPADGLWYLVSLFFWRIFLNYTPQNIKNKTILHFCLIIGISLLAGFVPLGRIMSFQRTFAFYPLFVFGYYLKDWYVKLRSIPKLVPVAVLLLYVVLIFFTSVPPINVLLQRTPYDTANIAMSILSKGFFYAWTIPISLSVISLFPDIKLFSKEGSYTLFYYMYHMFFVLLFRYLVINTGLECDILTVFIYAFVSFATMALLRHITVFSFLINPLSFIKKKSILNS